MRAHNSPDLEQTYKTAAAEMERQLHAEKAARAEADKDLAVAREEVSILSADIFSLGRVLEARDAEAKRLAQDRTESGVTQAQGTEALKQEAETWRARVVELERELQQVSYTLTHVQNRCLAFGHSRTPRRRGWNMPQAHMQRASDNAALPRT